MSTLGNVLWLLFGGILIAIEYLISSVLLMITIIGIPFGFQTLKLAELALWPFGREAVPTDETGGCLSVFMNVLWIFIGGFWIALSHLAMALILFITIIGIPFAIQHIKLAGLALTPFGRMIVEK
ncbi:MAG: YccF domain-containing protein [Bacteroidales bacterium]|nr:YccF domain-containing protein [Bacteroidales bacterium]